MSYEVYVDVRHHPRHLEDYEHHLSWCAKRTTPTDSAPSDADRVRTVVDVLREMADHFDPDTVCANCAEPRSKHHDWLGLPRCFGRYGPVTQGAWWVT